MSTGITLLWARIRRGGATGLCFLAGASAGTGAALTGAAPLPAGVEAVWDLGKAFHETTPTRERICLNGLWEWQPAGARTDGAPEGNWGYFKAPGCWPGITDYMEKDCQTVFSNPGWTNRDLGGITAAWYRREFRAPESWAGRRVALRAEYVNSFAAVYVDGARAGEIHFPGGELDITAACRPGTTQALELLVAAMPLQGVMLSYTDSASAREVKGTVERRGLCGDVYLTSTPGGARLGDVRVETSERKKECTFDAGLEGLAAGEEYRLRAVVWQEGGSRKTFTSAAFRGSELKEGRMALTGNWRPDRLWDTDTPQTMCAAEVSLLDGAGRVLDTGWRERFGFREFWIEGRDFYLNGKRIFLCAAPLDNAQVSAGAATYAAARESLERLKSIGINYVYTHNYGCEPGSHLGFEEILRAADDTGMLVGFSEPHFSHYQWEGPEADQTNGYARHAEYYTRAAQNHPSVVMYSMSHNATGYDEDMNPDMIDGIHDARDLWARRNAGLALRAEAIVRRLDPSRIVYHHASGNLGAMDAINFYPNFAPAQELSDWFEHWATQGVKPVFTCEYGAPFTWDWTMYRGWYKGQREWGSAVVPWEFCVAEWDAQFFGDRAYQISEAEKQNLRWEAKEYQAGRVWHRWDYPVEAGSSRLEERYPVFALYLTDNWRAYRTWGVSGISPWEYGHYWKLREGVDKRRKELAVDWENLQRPGFSPDYIGERYERMDTAYERSDWIATPAAQALVRNNGPLLAWLAGKAGAFTSKDHNFYPGETVEKQLILINNSRQSVTCDCAWSLDLPRPQTGGKRVTVGAGQQERIALRFALPATLTPGGHELSATVKFSNGETQKDSLALNITPTPAAAGAARAAGAKIAVFDPKGETRALLGQLGIAGQAVGA
ncbi:MAG: glycoside hydrolase family 2 TIM barrel-domain containing protein, partial [Verrucomicrobiota bacterium]